MGSDHIKSATYRRMVASVMRSDGVRATDKAVFLAIASYASSDGSNCRPSADTIAHVLDMDVKATWRAIMRLKAKGWLSWTYHATKLGRVNLYTLHWSEIGPDRVPPKADRVDPKKGSTGRPQKGVKTLLHISEPEAESPVESIDYDESNPFNE